MSQKQDVVCLSNLVPLGSVTVKGLLVQSSDCVAGTVVAMFWWGLKFGRNGEMLLEITALSKGQHEAEIHSLIDYGCEPQKLCIVTVLDR